MNVPKAVIGAGYGDEGKGLITDYLCAKHGADVVVRFNGGAQAGHTVQTPAGERHVFSHFGSGTYTGAATFLSAYFVVNPMVFFKEAEMLCSPLRNSIPDVYIDPHARVTTPYDMLINQLVEQERGANRHGSCGIGFGETIERSLSANYRLTWEMVSDPDSLSKLLKNIRDIWFPARCQALGIDPAKGDHIIKNDNVFKNYLRDATAMFDACGVAENDLLLDSNQIIFEGAQGLLLDEHLGQFPHVTRSNTGLHNITKILASIGVDELEATYVTRCYATRHGAGPFDHELPGIPYPDVYDETNITNTYQGSLRFAYLDADIIKNAINKDLNMFGCGSAYVKVQSGLAVTCLDQLGCEPAMIYMNGALQKIRSDIYGDVGDMINGHIGLKLPVIKSYGPTRADIVHNEEVVS